MLGTPNIIPIDPNIVPIDHNIIPWVQNCSLTRSGSIDNTIEKILKNKILDQKVRFLRTFSLNSENRYFTSGI